MKKIIGSRGIGKTRNLFEIAQKEGATVVCANPTVYANKARVYGIYGLTFIGYEDFIKSNITEKIVIDDVDNFISRCFPNIIGFSLSVD